MWLQIFIVAVIGCIYWLYFSKPINYPPGYWGLPLIGYLPFNKTVDEAMKDLQKISGDRAIGSWRVGTVNNIIIFDDEISRKALSSVDFAYRPDMLVLGFCGHTDLGIIKSNGPFWHEKRRFSIHHLRDYGMGKSAIIPAIQNEAVELANSVDGKIMLLSDFYDASMVNTLNVMSELVGCKRSERGDKQMKELTQRLHKFRENLDYMNAFDYMPWIQKVFPAFLYKRLFKINIAEEFASFLKDIINEDISRHQKNLDMDNPKDLIDTYLIEMEKQKGDPNSILSDEDLIILVGDFYGAGTETSSTAITWTIFCLLQFPECQKKMQEEIDRVLPNGNLITLEDKPNLSYTEAFINETLRYSSFIKLGLMRTNRKDTVLEGYNIPKGTCVFTANTYINFDEKYFDAPNEFRPERFLDADGKFSSSKSRYQPFGSGKRKCIGETMARIEVLFFVATIVQRYTISVPPGETLVYAPLETAILRLPNLGQQMSMVKR